MPAARTITVCPHCGGPVHHEGGWPPWCPACEWGLVPESRQPDERTRIQRWQARRRETRVLATHRALLGKDLHASGARRVVGTILGLLVHLLTSLLVVGAAWIWTTGTFTVAKVIGSLLALGIVWEVRPRLGHLPTGDNALDRVKAPHSFAVLDEVARVTGSHAPDVLVVAPIFNASVGRVGLRGRNVMTIGLPLWTALSDDQRIAVLGHECGHEVNGDIRSTLVVGTAIESLHRWAGLLRPDVRATRRRWIVGSTGGALSLFTIAEYLVPVILLPMSVGVGLLALGLERVAARSGQRAEYRADELSARAAGTAAAIATLDHQLIADSCMNAMRTAARADRNADVWAAQRRFLDALSSAQWERLRRLAAREEHRADASHPPTLLRQEMLRSRPPVDGLAQLSTDQMAAMSAELEALAPAMARLLRDAAATAT